MLDTGILNDLKLYNFKVNHAKKLGNIYVFSLLKVEKVVYDIKYLSAFSEKFKYYQIFWRFCYCNANFNGDFRKISKYTKLFNRIG